VILNANAPVHCVLSLNRCEDLMELTFSVVIAGASFNVSAGKLHAGLATAQDFYIAGDFKRTAGHALVACNARVEACCRAGVSDERLADAILAGPPDSDPGVDWMPTTPQRAPRCQGVFRGKAGHALPRVPRSANWLALSGGAQ
jgi:hypothetical protein